MWARIGVTFRRQMQQDHEFRAHSDGTVLAIHSNDLPIAQLSDWYVEALEKTKAIAYRRSVRFRSGSYRPKNSRPRPRQLGCQDEEILNWRHNRQTELAAGYETQRKRKLDRRPHHPVGVTIQGMKLDRLGKSIMSHRIEKLMITSQSILSHFNIG